MIRRGFEDSHAVATASRLSRSVSKTACILNNGLEWNMNRSFKYVVPSTNACIGTKLEGRKASVR